MGFISNNLLKVIQWEDNSKDTLVYKFPMDGRQIMNGSKLTVRESQIAIFVNKGKIADIFEPGMYKLETSNLPILTSLMSWPYGFKSPFYADVYFINTKQFTNLKWGTSNPIAMRDKEFGTIRHMLLK
jgi:membrane protease subunit (stomatin/prohibitin family)